ncbi:hypothetical protein I6A84_41555, partial [Frankia sp. CNm7]|nr:hypothetical protein [Frankia nepalensis]
MSGIDPVVVYEELRALARGRGVPPPPRAGRPRARRRPPGGRRAGPAPAP